MNHHLQSPGPRRGPDRAEALEGHVALAIAARLQHSADKLPHDITERLRFAREQALAAAAQQRLQAAAPVPATVLVQASPAAVLGGPPSVWLRLASWLPLVLLVSGLVLIQHHHELEQISAAAEIDSALLADELPPDAYGDPGFGEFLRSGDLP